MPIIEDAYQNTILPKSYRQTLEHPQFNLKKETKEFLETEKNVLYAMAIGI